MSRNLTTVTFLIGSLVLPVKTPASCKSNGSQNQKADRIIVYGDGFAFSIKEPEGWQSDCENAGKLGANIAFIQSNETFENAPVIIRVKVNSKTDDDISADLNFDMDGYLEKFKEKIRFVDFPMTHPKYKAVSKLFTVPNEFYEYVVYLNPGKGKAFIFSVSMNRQKQKAASKEMEAFQDVCKSLELL